MITLNGSNFAKNDEEMVGSLFYPGGTCKGYYKTRKRGVDLLDLQGRKVGVVTRNRVLAKVTKQDDGKYWYSYGTIDLVGEYTSYKQQCEEIDKILELLNT